MLNVLKAQFPFVFHIEVFGSDSSHSETTIYSRVILNEEGDYIPLSEEGKEIVTKANKAYGVEARSHRDFPHTATLESLGYSELPVYSIFHGGLQELYYAVLESGVPAQIDYLCYGGKESKDLWDYSYEETLIQLPNGASCVVIEDHEKEEMYFAWYFPGKKEVWLGRKQSLALLKEHNAVPLFLQPLYHASFRFDGDEMSLHYSILQLKKKAEELGLKGFHIDGFKPNKYESLLDAFDSAITTGNFEKASELFQELERIIPAKDATWLALKVKLEGINPKLDNIENW